MSEEPANLGERILGTARCFDFPLFGYEKLCRKLWPDKRSSQWTRTAEYRRVLYWCDKLHEQGLIVSWSGVHGDRCLILAERLKTHIQPDSCREGS